MSDEEELVKLVHGKLRKSKGDDMSAEVTSRMSKKRRGVNEEGKEAAEPQKSKSKEVKKRKHVGDEGNAEPSTERKNKRRREHEASLNESKSKSIRVGDENLKGEGGLKNRKNRKNRKNPEHDRIAEAGQLGELEGSAKTERKKKKTRDKDGESIKKIRRKNGTDLPDPEDDTSLASQARKALIYAYQQFDDPASWKFNKARQNWLIRNVWSNQAIPESYTPLLTCYLANVKGGVREKLVADCQSIISPIPTVPAGPTPQQPIATTENGTETLKQRARTILDALSIKP